MNNKQRGEVAQLHAQVCSALGDATRILLMYSLANQPYMVNDLAHLLDLPQTTVSRHLKILYERGLVTSQRDGRCMYYALADQRIIQALDLLRAVLTDALDSRVALAHMNSHPIAS
jgi:DNA-binding transcriptional ArsR family regulator